jgi:N-formylglutamate amidohydrolase
MARFLVAIAAFCQRCAWGFINNIHMTMSTPLAPFETCAAYLIHGTGEPLTPLVLDSPHSGHEFPDDFGAIVSPQDLRDGEDCFIDDLYRPAGTLGIPLLAAQFPRTYLDPNRHAGDIDLDLVEGGVWPHDHRPSGKAAIGKALVWRTLDDGRPIYDRRLGVGELLARIERCHTPYHAALRRLLDAAHARFGQVVHLNCHSMNAVSGAMGEGGAGIPRADIVLGDRDGSTCSPALTAFVRNALQSRGYEVKVNDPFKGVELVRAYADPAAGRHSLQIEINKRLYMVDAPQRQPHEGFARLQRDLMAMLEALSAAAQAGRLNS